MYFAQKNLKFGNEGSLFKSEFETNAKFDSEGHITTQKNLLLSVDFNELCKCNHQGRSQKFFRWGGFSNFLNEKIETRNFFEFFAPKTLGN